jgi:predicted MFS family arabinose efflux permease
MNTGDVTSGIAQAMLPKERRAVGVIALVAMCRMFGLFALLPVLAIYSANLDGATPLLIGLAVGAYGLTQAALQIPFGLLSDKIGRLPVILIGLALFAAGSILAAMSDTISGVIAGRLLQGAGAISATLAALLADATREEVRTRSMAVLGIGFGASFLLALLVGPIIADQSGVRSLFWIAAILAAVAAALLLALPAGIQRPMAKSALPISAALRPELLRLDFYVFVLHALMTASFVAVPFVLRDSLNLEFGDYWKILGGALIVSLAGTIPLILTDERRGKQGTIGLAIVLLFVGLLILSYGSVAVTQTFIALAIFFAGFNFLEAGLPARLSILAHGELRGASLGVFSSSQFFGAFAGGLIGGGFMASGQPSRVFIACAVLALAWLLLHQFSGLGREQGEKR